MMLLDKTVPRHLMLERLNVMLMRTAVPRQLLLDNGLSFAAGLCCHAEKLALQLKMLAGKRSLLSGLTRLGAPSTPYLCMLEGAPQWMVASLVQGAKAAADAAVSGAPVTPDGVNAYLAWRVVRGTVEAAGRLRGSALEQSERAAGLEAVEALKTPCLLYAVGLVPHAICPAMAQVLESATAWAFDTLRLPIAMALEHVKALRTRFADAIVQYPDVTRGSLFDVAFLWLHRAGHTLTQFTDLIVSAQGALGKIIVQNVANYLCTSLPHTGRMFSAEEVRACAGRLLQHADGIIRSGCATEAAGYALATIAVLLGLHGELDVQRLQAYTTQGVPTHMLYVVLVAYLLGSAGCAATLQREQPQVQHTSLHISNAATAFSDLVAAHPEATQRALIDDELLEPMVFCSGHALGFFSSSYGNACNFFVKVARQAPNVQPGLMELLGDYDDCAHLVRMLVSPPTLPAWASHAARASVQALMDSHAAVREGVKPFFKEHRCELIQRINDLSAMPAAEHTVHTRQWLRCLTLQAVEHCDLAAETAAVLLGALCQSDPSSQRAALAAAALYTRLPTTGGMDVLELLDTPFVVYMLQHKTALLDLLRCAVLSSAGDTYGMRGVLRKRVQALLQGAQAVEENHGWLAALSWVLPAAAPSAVKALLATLAARNSSPELLAGIGRALLLEREAGGAAALWEALRSEQESLCCALQCVISTGPPPARAFGLQVVLEVQQARGWRAAASLLRGHAGLCAAILAQCRDTAALSTRVLRILALKASEQRGACQGCGAATTPEKKLRRCVCVLHSQFCSTACQELCWPAHKQVCTANACAGCGRLRGEEETPLRLRRCACGKALYCSAECQRRDWATGHARTCRA